MNNREIKFRIWNTAEKSFYITKLDDYGETSSGFPVKGYAAGDSGKDILQQFTGLKDKNGKEIYEGDILKVKSYDGWFDKEGFYYKSVVFYQEETASFVHANRPELGVGINFIHPQSPCERDYKVIGNIFENPELLDK